MAMRWSRQEDDILRDYGSLGAEACSGILAEECGTRRTVKAVQHRASLIGASLFEYHVCPTCGAKVKRLRPSGVCMVCHEILKAERQRTVAEKFAAEIRKLESAVEATGELEAVKREYMRHAVASHRARNRIKERYGDDVCSGIEEGIARSIDG